MSITSHLRLNYIEILAISVFFFIPAHFARDYSPYTCPPTLWKTRTDNNQEITARFQNWLAYRQHLCTKKDQDPHYLTKAQSWGGIGSHQTAAVANMLRSLELGHIFYPTGHYLWSYRNTSLCSRNISSVDCFNLPLTRCAPNKPKLDFYPHGINVTDAMLFLPHSADICTMATRAEKSLLWVMGQVYLYQTRLSPSLAPPYRDRFTRILKILSTNTANSSTRCLTASINVRTGHLDYGRRSFDGSEHLLHLLAENQRLLHLNSNQQICNVYVATTNPNATIFKDIPLGKLTFFRGLHFLLSPQFHGDNIASKEVEDQLPDLLTKDHMSSHFRPENLYLDYMADLRVAAEVDYYLGSHSNVMLFVAGLRSALHPEYANNRTCYLDSRVKAAERACFGSEAMTRFFREAVQGFNGGSIYFNDG